MYTHQEERSVEAICYKKDHVDRVVNIIEKKFDSYFKDFIELEAGYTVSQETIKKLAKSLGVDGSKPKKNVDLTRKYKTIVIESVNDFERDRIKYETIFDEESLDEYEDDPPYFKSTILRNECPIIHATLHNKRAKELDKYRREFNIADAGELLIVVRNLFDFAMEYDEEFYGESTYDLVNDYEDLQLSDLDTDNYTVYGVIGGGIKSHMLYKVYPWLFPNRSRDALWALWYLSDKKPVDCKQDSEFLMIDIDKSITQQNYFYPYELFTFYAHQIYQLLNQKANELDVYLDPNYRYVYVDSFLSFISKQHDEEIIFLKQQIKDGGFGYA